jgi:hypothetical protein
MVPYFPSHCWDQLDFAIISSVACSREAISRVSVREALCLMQWILWFVILTFGADRPNSMVERLDMGGLESGYDYVRFPRRIGRHCGLTTCIHRYLLYTNERIRSYNCVAVSRRRLGTMLVLLSVVVLLCSCTGVLSSELSALAYRAVPATVRYVVYLRVISRCSLSEAQQPLTYWLPIDSAVQLSEHGGDRHQQHRTINQVITLFIRSIYITLLI